MQMELVTEDLESVLSNEELAVLRGGVAEGTLGAGDRIKELITSGVAKYLVRASSSMSIDGFRVDRVKVSLEVSGSPGGIGLNGSVEYEFARQVSGG